jgi:predicted Kef-type K+ transport protein
MDPVWISIAFILGFAVRTIGLPPLVGYLIAGFILNFIGAESGDFIQTISDLGITLLLFTIGLKFKIKNLLRPEIWAGATLHSVSTTLIYSVLIFILSFSTLHGFSDLSIGSVLLIAFALSFSSTVFAVKVLEDKGEMNSLHGRVSIGVLIMQDIFAVVFMAVVASSTPDLWSLLLPLGLIIIRPLLLKLLDWSGHGELLILYGFFLALVAGAEVFYLLGLKPDLGALVIGMLVADHPKSNEMAKTLLSFKDIFLIGFFLSVGLSATPTINSVMIALLITTFVAIKVVLYFIIFTRFKLRARTSYHATLNLANFSEFGLIVSSVGVAYGMVSSDWLVIIAIALSITFIIAAPLNSRAHKFFASFKERLHVFETRVRLEDDKTFDIGNAEILIFGMGRVGAAAYDQLIKEYGQKVLGLDYDTEMVELNRKRGRRVIHDDATDSEFWERIKARRINSDQVKLIMLCMHDHKANLYAIERLKAIDYNGMLAAIARYDDEVEELKQLGVHTAFNFFTEAGVGFADHVCELLGESFSKSCDIELEK